MIQGHHTTTTTPYRVIIHTHTHHTMTIDLPHVYTTCFRAITHSHTYTQRYTQGHPLSLVHTHKRTQTHTAQAHPMLASDFTQGPLATPTPRLRVSDLLPFRGKRKQISRPAPGPPSPDVSARRTNTRTVLKTQCGPSSRYSPRHPAAPHIGCSKAGAGQHYAHL